MIIEEPLPEADALDGALHPRFTRELLGQQKAEDAFLSTFNSGRLHHAWLITGPRGVGKATLAWKIARFLLAQPNDDGGMFADAAPAPDRLDGDPEHPVNRRVAALAEPRLALVRRAYDEKAKRFKQDITVEDIRNLKGFFNLSAADGGYRVALIDAADEMNSSAANALLKILEEPPEKTILLLVCHQPARLLPTIRSRCRMLQCETLGAEDLATALSAAVENQIAPSPALSELAEGSVGQAVTLSAAGGADLYANLVSVCSAAPGLDREAAIAIADKSAGRGAEATYQMTGQLLLTLISRHARFGAKQPATWVEAADGEARMLARLAPNADVARRWADTHQNLSARLSHARAVNLDPSSVILDMFLKFDATARG